MRTRMLLCAVAGGARLRAVHWAHPGSAQEGRIPAAQGRRQVGLGKAGDLKKYDDVITKDATTQPGVFAVHRHRREGLLRDPAGQARPADPLAGRGRQGAGRRQLGRGRRSATPCSSSSAAATRSTSGRSGSPSGPTARPSRPPSRPPRPTRSSPRSPSSARARTARRSSTCRTCSSTASRTCRSPGRRRRRRRASTRPGRTSSDVKAFPTNIEVRALLTFRGGGGGGPNVPGLPPGVGGGGARSVTALVHHSLAILPETPMHGPALRPARRLLHRGVHRLLAPEAVGRRAASTSPASGWRRRTRRPTSASRSSRSPSTSSKEIPEKWRPYLKKGVEDWKPAFEKAGFKNAIVCKDAPTRAEDPNWDPEDARYSRHPLGGRAGRQRDGAARPRPALAARSSRPTSSSGTTS